MLLQAAAWKTQNQDCNMAMQVCQALVQMAQQGQGGAPEEAGQPVYHKGEAFSTQELNKFNVKINRGASLGISLFLIYGRKEYKNFGNR